MTNTNSKGGYDLTKVIEEHEDRFDCCMYCLHFQFKTYSHSRKGKFTNVCEHSKIDKDVIFTIILTGKCPYFETFNSVNKEEYEQNFKLGGPVGGTYEYNGKQKRYSPDY